MTLQSSSATNLHHNQQRFLLRSHSQQTDNVRVIKLAVDVGLLHELLPLGLAHLSLQHLYGHFGLFIVFPDEFTQVNLPKCTRTQLPAHDAIFVEKVPIRTRHWDLKLGSSILNRCLGVLKMLYNHITKVSYHIELHQLLDRVKLLRRPTINLGLFIFELEENVSRALSPSGRKNVTYLGSIGFSSFRLANQELSISSHHLLNFFPRHQTMVPFTLHQLQIFLVNELSEICAAFRGLGIFLFVLVLNAFGAAGSLLKILR